MHRTRWNIHFKDVKVGVLGDITQETRKSTNWHLLFLSMHQQPWLQADPFPVIIRDRLSRHWLLELIVTWNLDTGVRFDVTFIFWSTDMFGAMNVYYVDWHSLAKNSPCLCWLAEACRDSGRLSITAQDQKSKNCKSRNGESLKQIPQLYHLRKAHHGCQDRTPRRVTQASSDFLFFF